MFYFLARIGKKGWTKHVIPTITVCVSSGYLLGQTLLHNKVRDLFAAQNPSGERRELSRGLKDLVLEAYNEVKDQYGTSFEFAMTNPKAKKSDIKWFCTSTLDPISFGYSEGATGVLIGLPNNFNYEKDEDVPPDALRYKKLSLFKTTQEKSNDEADEKEGEPMIDPSVVSEIDVGRASEDSEEYKKSLVLSKHAKKFAIARELFYVDNLRVIFMFATILLSFQIPLALSRGLVKKWGLHNMHLSRRIPLYLTCGLTGLFHYNAISSAIDLYYVEQSDSRALELGETYREGAIEYFEKVLQRNKILGRAVEDFKNVFDDEGNVRSYLFTNLGISVSQRLKRAILRQQQKSVDNVDDNVTQ